MKVFLLSLLLAFAAAAPVEDSGNVIDVIVNGVPEGEALDIQDIVDIKLKEHVDGVVASTSNLLHAFTAEGLAEAALAEEPVEPIEVAEEIEPQPIDLLPVMVEETVVPEPIVLPESIAPEVIPTPVVLPELTEPVVAPSPVVLPEPAEPEVVPSPVVLPEPAEPEVVPSPVVLPEPAVPEVVLPEPAEPEVIPSPVVLPEPVNPEVVPSPVEIVEPVVPEVVAEAPEAETEIINGEVYNDGLVQITVNTPEDAGIFATLQGWVNLVLNYFNNGVQTTQQIL